MTRNCCASEATALIRRNDREETHTTRRQQALRWISGSTSRAPLELPALPASIGAMGVRETASDCSGREFSRIQVCGLQKFTVKTVKINQPKKTVDQEFTGNPYRLRVIFISYISSNITRSSVRILVQCARIFLYGLLDYN